MPESGGPRCPPCSRLTRLFLIREATNACSLEQSDLHAMAAHSTAQ
jgi:hypothetical protein